MRWLHKAVGKAVVTTVCSGVAIGIGLTIGIADGNCVKPAVAHRTQPANRAAHAADVLPTSLANAFPMLQSAPTRFSASLTSDVQDFEQEDGLIPSRSLKAGRVRGNDVWIVPGTSGTCIELGSGYSGCGSNSFVEQRGAWLILRPVDGSASTVYGVLPHGASASPGTPSTKITRDGSAIAATTSGDAQGEVDLTTPAGTKFRVPVLTATGKPQSP